MTSSSCWMFVWELLAAGCCSMLVVVSVFDREVTVRRAAAAAFQENVGRQVQTLQIDSVPLLCLVQSFALHWIYFIWYNKITSLWMTVCLFLSLHVTFLCKCHFFRCLLHFVNFLLLVINGRKCFSAPCKKFHSSLTDAALTLENYPVA